MIRLCRPGQARAAMPFSGPLMAVEICHDAQVTTVWLDADGKEHQSISQNNLLKKGL